MPDAGDEGGGADECRPLPYSDIDLARWREYDHVWTDSLWHIDARDRTGGHQLDYHGNFVPQIATQMFLRYTKENDIVVDLFLDSGTSAIEAVRLNRRLTGVDLRSDPVRKVRGKIPPELLHDRIRLLDGDSADPAAVGEVRRALQAMGADRAQLVMLHPRTTTSSGSPTIPPTSPTPRTSMGSSIGLRRSRARASICSIQADSPYW